jgi:predicted small secreted protein
MKHGRWLALALIMTTVAACNTVEGVGRDISGGANVVRGWFSH